MSDTQRSEMLSSGAAQADARLSGAPGLGSARPQPRDTQPSGAPGGVDRPDGAWSRIPMPRTEFRATVAVGYCEPDHFGPPEPGFGTGDRYDLLAPGPELARLAEDAAGPGQACAALDDEELVGVMCAWQRLAAWAEAGMAAAVTALAVRRAQQARNRSDNHDLDTYVRDEIAAALTLTGLSAGRLLDTSAAICHRLPNVHAALAEGRIDWPRAKVFADELSVLDDDQLAQKITANRLPHSGINTTGQLRARLRRDVLDADPAAAEERRHRGRQETRLEVWTEDSGNAALSGRELPPARALALFKQITATANWLKDHGVIGTINDLRAEVYLALLSGRDPATLLAEPRSDVHPPDAKASAAETSSSPSHSSADDPHGSDDPGSAGYPTAGSAPASTRANGAKSPQLTGTINLTMPLTAWAGLTRNSGEVAGFGPTDAATCYEIASWADTVTRWCLTLTDEGGSPAAHACAPGAGPPPGQPALHWAAGVREKLRYLETGTCSHAREASGYRPPDNLAHLVKVRHRVCSFPGCRRAARFCDLDHTLAYASGGKTCECNLAPLCRRHHRAKQTFGWHLVQTSPGQLTWQLPHNRSYQTTGEPYPA
jgi:hypothetical protein